MLINPLTSENVDQHSSNRFENWVLSQKAMSHCGCVKVALDVAYPIKVYAQKPCNVNK